MAVVIRLLIPLVLMAGLLYILWTLYRDFLIPRAKKADEEFLRHQNQSRQAIEDYQSVRNKWLSYELDDEALLERPSMLDMRVPEVAYFHRSLRSFEEKYQDSHKLAKNAPVSDEFIQDAQLLVQALKEAEKRADGLDSGN